jgi:hypothetical protein
MTERIEAAAHRLKEDRDAWQARALRAEAELARWGDSCGHFDVPCGCPNPPDPEQSYHAMRAARDAERERAAAAEAALADLRGSHAGLGAGSRTAEIKTGRYYLAALRLIADRPCERLPTGPASCWRQPTWRANAEYTDGRWCAPCTALAALSGRPLDLARRTTTDGDD